MSTLIGKTIVVSQLKWNSTRQNLEHIATKPNVTQLPDNYVGYVQWPYVSFSDAVAQQPWSRVCVSGYVFDIGEKEEDSKKT